MGCSGDPVHQVADGAYLQCMDSRIDTSGDDKAVATWIWRNLVPKSGQALTVQGELLRAVEKLRWEAQENGNINWDDGFVLLTDFLRVTLTTHPGFNDSDRRIIKSDLDRLKHFVPPGETRGSLPYVEDDLYDRLTTYVVRFSRDRPTPIARLPNPELHR